MHGFTSLTSFDMAAIYIAICLFITLILAPVFLMLTIALRFSAPLKGKILGSLACSAFAVALGMALMIITGSLESPARLTWPLVVIIMIALPFLGRWVFREGTMKVLALVALIAAPFLISPDRIVTAIVRAIMGVNY